MGYAKHHAMDLKDEAHLALLESKAVAPCYLHSDIYVDQFDEEANRKAYSIGTNRVKHNQIQCDRSKLMAAIKSAKNTAYEHCPRCAKLRSA